MANPPTCYREGVVYAKARDLRAGVRCDLQGDPVADVGDEHPEFEFEFQTVDEVEHFPEVTVVAFTTGFVCGFPPDHEVEVDGEQDWPTA